MKKNKKTDGSEKNPIKQIAEEEKMKKENPTPLEENKVEEVGEDDGTEWRGASCILPDGTLVEMLYDAEKLTSKLAVYKEGKVSLEDSISVGHSTVFMPMVPNQSILR